MIAKLIRWSVANRFLVLLATAMLTAWGVWGVRSTPVDALPDLSDVQVIIRTNYPGQAPQIVENQVTYPLATTMLSVPGAKTVRGFSFFGDSFVYVLFEDGTDLYWARSRVLEYLNQVQGRLPATAKPALGPDATGVGWIFQYALVDRTGKNDLAQLRALQDWFLKFELKSLPNVAEVASVGGMVKQYQVVLDPIKLASYGLSQAQVRDALMGANQETGGSVLELSGAEYMVRASGYLKTLDEFREIPLTARGGVPVRLGDVATLQIGPEMRRGIAELDGEGEVAGGVVVLRSGKNAQETIAAVKAKLAELQGSLVGVSLIVGVIFGLSGTASAIAAPLWGRAGQSRGGYRILVAAFVGAGIFNLGQALVGNIVQFGALQFMVGLFLIGVFPSINVIALGATEANFQGRVFGLTNAANQLGSMVGPLVGGFVSSLVGIRPVYFLTGSTLLVLGAYVFWGLLKKK